MIWVYTDGSVSRPEEGTSPGGWAFTFRDGDKVIKNSGCCKSVTNNQMEMVAPIKAMQALLAAGYEGSAICIVSDSQYLINGASKWMVGWKRMHWHNSKGRSIKNKEYWKQIDYLASQFTVRWKWVRGHNGNPENEIVDKLARQAAFRSAGIYDTANSTGPLELSHPA